MEREALPPFRSDEKGLVEKTFDVLQQKYKPLLRGKGVIEGDAQERWATDYRSQALLNLTEFTRVILHCVIYINSRRILKNFIPTAEMCADRVEPIPAALWQWHERQGAPRRRVGLHWWRKGRSISVQRGLPAQHRVPSSFLGFV